MSDTVDASSKYQDSLPISSDAIIKQLDDWGIAYIRSNHVPLRTVEDSKKVQGQFLSSEQGGGHIKNLYLRDNKKRNILLVAEQDRQIDLKNVHTKLETGRLSFGSAARLMENLGVRPGAVTPLSMINGVEAGVQLFIDSGLKSCQQIYVHPLVNDRTLGITLEDLEKFFNKIKVEPVWVDLE
ncbi:prolyl-tRNA synthetase associated domain-containing protein [Ascidiaceihabitans sp.]|jgi:Ala-tRNA(Pro) deacylase|nr:prolyl-tRNA synthetase associated domain-containing protein [Ascidiaceihabitans sp.]MDB4211744.1 prolyl-tRNA synthetase associated domain-containing protein [Ascidiaceihabitans sp.]HCI05811.1 aminoacyl-tRNA deacylase [Sulfitobacter sp.]